MLSGVIIFFVGFLASGIVTSIARQKKDNDVFGLGSAAFFATIAMGLLGLLFFGFSGGIFGSIVGAILIEEVIRAKLNKPKSLKKKVFCSKCGFKQEWNIDKECENCGELLRI